MKKYLSVLLIIVTVFMLTGCSTKEDPDAQRFVEKDFEIKRI